MPTIHHRVLDRDPTVSAGSAVAITPNDSADLDDVTRGIYVGNTGNIRVILERDTASVDFVGVLTGSILPIRAKRVLSTGTTATGLVALI